jgi:hypothetical protein
MRPVAGHAEPPPIPLCSFLLRTGTANAPLQVVVRVNKPVEGGVPIRLTLGEATFELQPGTDVLTRRESFTWGRAPDRLSRSHRTASTRCSPRCDRQTVDGSGSRSRERRRSARSGSTAWTRPLRYVDEPPGTQWRAGRADRQGRARAGRCRRPEGADGRRHLAESRSPASFKREKCEERLASFDELSTGFVAMPAPRT